MLSCHEWIANASTLSCYGNMMKKEMDKEDTLEDTYGAEEIIWSPSEKIKEHQTITQDEI